MIQKQLLFQSLERRKNNTESSSCRDVELWKKKARSNDMHTEQKAPSTCPTGFFHERLFCVPLIFAQMAWSHPHRWLEQRYDDRTFIDMMIDHRTFSNTYRIKRVAWLMCTLLMCKLKHHMIEQNHGSCLLIWVYVCVLDSCNQHLDLSTILPLTKLKELLKLQTCKNKIKTMTMPMKVW